jgi:subtilase family serine protease
VVARLNKLRVIIPLAAVVVAAAVTVPIVLSGSSPSAPSSSSRTGTSAPTPARSSAHIEVLSKALAKMEAHYASYARYVPGPSDIVDYGIGRLWLKGIDGTGTTIALLEGWDFPGIDRVVASFDAVWGLPNPVIDTIYPSGNGRLPARCPAGMVTLGSYGSCDAWGRELTLDVLAAHLIAPYARILLAVTPADSEVTDDGASQVAPYEMMRALEIIARRHLANVVSVSTGTAETSYSHGSGEITAQSPGLLAAAEAGIPVCEGTGDRDVVQALPSLNGDLVTKTPGTAAWDDSPWVTAVGGSVPNLTARGARRGPDPIWQVGNYGESAGYSSVFARPTYQDGVASITRSAMRSVPDITMDAREGTSEAGPLLAGVLALATQMAGENVGPINPVLYQVLGPRGKAAGIADVVSGNNDYVPNKGATVGGFSAAKGFDVASGWGTIYAPSFVPALVAATRQSSEESYWRDLAAADLEALQREVTLTTPTIAAGGTTYLLAKGFLPHHPVRLDVDGKSITTLLASSLGTVSYTLDPSSSRIAPGRHNLVLVSMLLDETTKFTSG